MIVGEVVEPVRRTPERLVMVVDVSHVSNGEASESLPLDLCVLLGAMLT